MAKIIQDRTEQEALDRLNGITQERIRQAGEQVKEALTKAAENAERSRKRKMAGLAARCFLAAAGIVGLYLAQDAGLISTVLTHPVYAIGFTYLGWHLCKLQFGGRK